MPLNKETKRNLSDSTTPDQSGPGSDATKAVLYIPYCSSITGASPLGF